MTTYTTKALSGKPSGRVDITSAVGLAGLLVTLAVSQVVTPYMVIATINYFTLLLGLTFLKKNKKMHAILMFTAIISDLALVLVLEIQRGAIAEAVSFKLSVLNQLHILCSSVATFFYIPILVLGIGLFRRSLSSYRIRRIHGKLGIIAVVFRTLGFFLMFSMLGIHHS